MLQVYKPDDVGTEVKCQRCQNLHVLEQPYADKTTAERTHVYVTCRGQRYFVGQVVQSVKR